MLQKFNWEQTDAPVFSARAGKLATVLDAVLVDGFGSVAIDSLEVASNVATVTTTENHPFSTGDVVLLSGVTASTGVVKTVSVDTAGNNYAVNDELDVTTDPGTGLVVKVSTISGGKGTGPVTGVTIEDAGSSFVDPQSNCATTSAEDDRAEVTKVDFDSATTASLAGKYFTINSTTVSYYVWFDLDDGSQNPAPQGKTGIEVNIATGDDDEDIAGKARTVLENHAAFVATVDGTIVTITNYVAGSVTDATAGDSGLSVIVYSQGGKGSGCIIDITEIDIEELDELNDKFIIVKTEDDEFTFDITLGDVTAAGDIVASYAPLGYEIYKTGTNKRAYRSLNSDTSQYMIRIDDSNDTHGLVRFYTSMSNIDTGSGNKPTTITIDSLTVADNVATATCATAHELEVGDTALISGVTGDLVGINGSHTVTTVNVPSKIFTFYTSESDGTGAGTMLLNNHLYIQKNSISDGSELSVSSLVVADDVATVTTSTSHNLSNNDVVTISGCTTTYTDLNDNWTITVTGTDTFTFDVDRADGTSTGTIKAIKYVERPWYVYGDDTFFHLLLEVAPDVYNDYIFGDYTTIHSGTADKEVVLSALKGINGKQKLVSSKAGTVVARSSLKDKGNYLYQNSCAENVTKVDSTITLPLLLDSEELSEVVLTYNNVKAGIVPYIYVPYTNKMLKYDNLDVVMNSVENDPNKYTDSFKCVLGSFSHVGNIFIENPAYDILYS